LLPGFEHINRYFDRQHEMMAAKILPGEFYVTTQDEYITTVLGSCISACVWDEYVRVGGMNHFMLPEGNNQSWLASDTGESARYGNVAMERLINEVLKHGGRRSRLKVKIFGGGQMLAQMTDIGPRNILFVEDYIRTENLVKVGEDLGDVYPRKVMFFPMTGRARVKRLRALSNDTVIRREKDYMHRIEKVPAAGEVELF
jgi:chemotaxis protein CheD